MGRDGQKGQQGEKGMPGTCNVQVIRTCPYVTEPPRIQFVNKLCYEHADVDTVNLSYLLVNYLFLAMPISLYHSSGLLVGIHSSLLFQVKT